MERIINLSVCSSNQWALDFSGNLERILKTCQDAYDAGARIRLGSELEIPGYGCLDHFYECDMEWHSWEILQEITRNSKKWPNLLIITGMPITYKSGLYNCMVALSNGRLVFVYAKSVLANDDIYRESRWFVPWQRTFEVVNLSLNEAYNFEQVSVPFGSGYIQSSDGVKIGFEMCEELWTARSPHVELTLQGVDIVCNASGSHHVLGKSCKRINQLVIGATSKLGVVYLYANQRGCDGDRLFYDGMSSIAQNEDLYTQINQFDIEDTCVQNAILDLNHSTVHRRKIASNCQESSRAGDIPCISFDAQLLIADTSAICLSKPIDHLRLQRTNVDELCHGPPAWLWHYLRRSGMNGFFLPLSGGQDSCAVAIMVRLMCEKVCKAVRSNTGRDDPSYYFQGKRVGQDPAELCSKIFYTCYLGSKNSSTFTQEAANGIAKDIGSTHANVSIDPVVSALEDSYECQSGSRLNYNNDLESLSLQNLQARTRMILSYLFAQTKTISPEKRGSLLVLGAANVDESLVGYLTKYDCSSADLNPIGSISKHDLREFLHHVNTIYNFPNLKRVIDSIPSAELRPLKDGAVVQTDEDEIGLTYEELSQFGRLRRPGCCGPYATFLQLCHIWRPQYSYSQIADKVELFYKKYALNRHKATILTPAYHANTYSNDDHRNDHRPFLYPKFEYQMRRIRETVKKHEESLTKTSS